MPTINIHIKLASMCESILQIKNHDDFMFGNTYPDFIEEDDSKRDMMHYYIPYENGKITYNASPVPDVMRFIVINRNLIQSDFYKGYLLHLVTDAVFNVFDNMRIGNDVVHMSKEEIIKLTDMKREDFISFGNNYDFDYVIRYGTLSKYVIDIIHKDFDFLVEDTLLHIRRLNQYISSGDYKEIKLYTEEEYNLLFDRCIQMVSYYYSFITEMSKEG